MIPLREATRPRALRYDRPQGRCWDTQQIKQAFALLIQSRIHPSEHRINDSRRRNGLGENSMVYTQV